MRDQMLDFRGEIERQVRELHMHLTRDSKAVQRPVQKIGIAESYMLRPAGYQKPDVFQHYFPRNDEEAASIYGWYWAMRAKVKTSSAGFRGADHLQAAVVLYPRVLRKRRT